MATGRRVILGAPVQTVHTYASIRAAARSRSPRAVIAERLPCLNGGERGACAPPSAIVAGSQGPATVGAQRRTVEHAAALHAARDRHSVVACSCFSCRGCSGSALVHCRLSALGESTAGPHHKCEDVKACKGTLSAARALDEHRKEPVRRNAEHSLGPFARAWSLTAFRQKRNPGVAFRLGAQAQGPHLSGWDSNST